MQNKIKQLKNTKEKKKNPENYIHKTQPMEGTEFDGRNKSRCLRNCNKYKLTQYPDKKAAD